MRKYIFQLDKVLQVLNAGVGLSTDTDSELIAQIISKSVAINLKCRVNESSFGDICKVNNLSLSNTNLKVTISGSKRSITNV